VRKPMQAHEALRYVRRDTILSVLIGVLSAATLERFAQKCIRCERDSLRRRYEKSDAEMKRMQALTDQDDVRVMTRVITAVKRRNTDAMALNRMIKLCERWDTEHGSGSGGA
jgi:hypothetical protein